jgi:3-hydroxybutyryl-CoA dehydratase
VDAYEPGHEFPVVERQISADDVRKYAQASGDFNPLHLDEDFAASTQFGRPIAHGMLALASISEVLASHFGGHWAAGGTIRARFKGPVYVGESISITVRINKVDENEGDRLVACAVSLRNSKGEDVLTATATVPVPSGEMSR